MTNLYRLCALNHSEAWSDDVVDMGEELGMKYLGKTIKRWKDSNDFSTKFLR